MEVWMIAVLLGLSLSSFLTAKIAKMLDMSYKMFLRFGVLFCVAAGVPLFLVIILDARKTPDSLFWAAWPILFMVVFDLIAAFRSKEKAIPPCVHVKRPGRVARAAKEVSFILLMGFVLYLIDRGSLRSLGQMSGWDLIACAFFTMAAIIMGFQTLFLRNEICGNGLLDRTCSPPELRPWEAYESFSWTKETKDGVELRLQAKSACRRTKPLMVRPEDREVVQGILEANLPDQSCVRVKRTMPRRLAGHIVSVLCWPAVVLLLVYLWKTNASWQTCSGFGVASIMITMGVNFWPSKIIEICKNGLLLGDELRAWEQYECFFWKGETGDGVELRLRLKSEAMTRLVVAPEDRKTVQQLLEVNLQDRTMDSEAYSGWSVF